jgi:phosphoribosylamine---glycine ligase
MKVMVVGNGGREHALEVALQGEAQVICAPGNGGTRTNVEVEAGDVERLLDLARETGVDFTVVGPEAPLAAGIVDRFQADGRAVFGPTQAAARLESSKAWAKDFFRRHGIRTGRAEVVDTAADARRAVERAGLPVVLKADWLAGGKGVFVATTSEDVAHALEALFPGKGVVLVEEYLEGEEVSVLAFADGERLAMMPPARDYKRLRDGDEGPNTGGMGGFTRAPYVSDAMLGEIEATVLRPTLAGMAAEGHPYQGVLYAGLMLTSDGPRVLEYNCRFGDPEAQLILPLLQSSLLETCQAAVEGRLDPASVSWADSATCGVVLAAPGYPENPRLGEAIAGLEQVDADVCIFHAGTRQRNDALVTAGGRVLTLVARGASVEAARQRVYEQVPLVRFDGAQWRSDIGS